jgi:hypothetical protein
MTIMLSFFSVIAVVGFAQILGSKHAHCTVSGAEVSVLASRVLVRGKLAPVLRSSARHGDVCASVW